MPAHRALLIWFLALSLSLEGMASMAMSHCKDMLQQLLRDQTPCQQGTTMLP